jgi:hypothetical protein
MAMMRKPEERIVELDYQVYAALNEALQIDERWYDPDSRGMVLYSHDWETGVLKKLIFKVREPKTSGEI